MNGRIFVAGLALVSAELLGGCGSEDRGPTDNRPIEDPRYNADGSVDAEYRGVSGGRVIVRFMCRDNDTANVYVDEPDRDPYSQDSTQSVVCEDEQITRDEIRILEDIID